LESAGKEMKKRQLQLIGELREMRDAKTALYEQYDEERILAILGSDPEVLDTLFQEFEKLPDEEVQKLFLANLILQRWPHLPSYVYVTKTLGLSTKRFTGRDKGVALLKSQGKI
jgi:hypothetical protein